MGGVETVLETTSEAMATAGHSVTVLTSSMRGVPEQEEYNGYSIIRSNFLRVPDNGVILPRDFDFQKTKAMFEELVSECKPEVIHFHNYQMRQYSMFLSCFLHSVDLTKHAILNTIHNDSDDSFSHYILSYSPLDVIITPTHKAAMDLFEARIPPNKFSIVPNMINVGRFENASGSAIRKRLGADPEDRIILFPSRLVGREGNFIFDSKAGKGLDVMIRAMPEIFEAIPNAKLMLLGNDPIFGAQVSEFKRKLSSMMNSLKPDSLLFFDEPIPNSLLPSVMAASDIVVSLSPREAFGMVFLEAMAASKPVVGANSVNGGVPEVVPDARAGLLVPPNDPHETAKAIVKILSDDALRRSFELFALDWVKKKFDVKVVAPQLAKIYRQILEAKKTLSAERKEKKSLAVEADMADALLEHPASATRSDQKGSLIDSRI